MANIICNDCDEQKLPPVNFSDCAPQLNLSEIEYIYVGPKNAKAFTSVADAAEWTTRLSESDIESPDVIRPLRVIGNLPAGSVRTKVISGNRTKKLGNDRTLNWLIDDVSDENYEFFRKFVECNSDVTFWFETRGGKLYGDNAGIKGSISGNLVLDEGADATETIQGTIIWDDNHSPDRVDSPIVKS